jgi:hypothetical protein
VSIEDRLGRKHRGSNRHHALFKFRQLPNATIHQPFGCSKDEGGDLHKHLQLMFEPGRGGNQAELLQLLQLHNRRGQ